jgi:membrane protease YdiL (CAAX protease family)
MARRPRLGPAMSRAEQICGWCYFPFYVALLSLILSYFLALFEIPVSQTDFSIACVLIHFSITLLLFHRFLFRSLRAVPHSFWAFVQAVILGFVFYFALNWLYSAVLMQLVPDLQNPNNDAVAVMADTRYHATLLCAVLLAPLTEETLVRGLLFGSIARRYRVLAYVVSMLVFAALHTWQFIGTVPLHTLLIAALQYLPAGLALGWTYEKAGNIWAPYLVHAAINALTMGLHLY